MPPESGKQRTSPLPAPATGDSPTRAPRSEHPTVPGGDALSAVADEELVSLLDVWCVLTRHKWMILATTLAGILAGTAAGLLMTPMYRAEVVLAPVAEDQGVGRYAAQLERFGGIAALAGVELSQHGSRKNEAIATLKSRLLTEQFIRDEKLLPVLFHDEWDARNERWSVRDPEDIPTLWDGYEFFDEKVRRISDDTRSGLVVLAIDWKDPQLAAQWGNELVRRVNVMLRNRTAEESQKAIDYLRGQLTQTSAVELKQVLHRLIESEMKKIILANVSDEFAFRVIDPGRAPGEAFRPRPVQMAVIAGVFSLIAGVILALVVDSAKSVPKPLRAKQGVSGTAA